MQSTDIAYKKNILKKNNNCKRNIGKHDGLKKHDACGHLQMQMCVHIILGKKNKQTTQ